MPSRRGELERTYFRTDRIFQYQNNWYFSTRENTDEGPYTSRKAAEHAVENYTRVMGSGLYQAEEDRVRLMDMQLQPLLS